MSLVLEHFGDGIRLGIGLVENFWINGSLGSIWKNLLQFS